VEAEKWWNKPIIWITPPKDMKYIEIANILGDDCGKSLDESYKEVLYERHSGRFRRYESLIPFAKAKEYYCRGCGSPVKFNQPCKYCGG
jgi:hypothetical protein